jgi:fatty-acid desaturase
VSHCFLEKTGALKVLGFTAQMGSSDSGSEVLLIELYNTAFQRWEYKIMSSISLYPNLFVRVLLGSQKNWKVQGVLISLALSHLVLCTNSIPHQHGPFVIIDGPAWIHHCL